MITMAFAIFFVMSTMWTFGGSWVDDIIKITMIPFAFLVFMFTAKNIPSGKFADSVGMFGRSSLGIYVMQFAFTRIGVDCSFMQQVHPMVLFFIAFALSYPICLLLAYIVEITSCSKPLRLILWGKR